MPKNFIGNTSSFQKISGSENFLWMRGGISGFPVEKKNSITVPESFIGNASWFEKISGIWRNKWTRREVSQSSVKTLVSCYRKDFWELFGVSKNFWQQKICMDERGGYQVFRLIFLSHITKNFVWVQYLFSQSFWQRKHFLDAGRISRSSVENFWSHTSENFLWELLRCFKNFLSAKSLYGWENGISRFSVEKFWITVPENFIGKSSWFQTLSIMGRNVWTIRG